MHVVASHGIAPPKNCIIGPECVTFCLDVRRTLSHRKWLRTVRFAPQMRLIFHLFQENTIVRLLYTRRSYQYTLPATHSLPLSTATHTFAYLFENALVLLTDIRRMYLLFCPCNLLPKRIFIFPFFSSSTFFFFFFYFFVMCSHLNKQRILDRRSTSHSIQSNTYNVYVSCVVCRVCAHYYLASKCFCITELRT